MTRQRLHRSENFTEECYRLLGKVPKGYVTTYKDLAEALGSRGYRAVGNAMNRNANAPKIPCHRVVKSSGEVGGYALGTAAKVKLLRSEGVKIKNNSVVELGKFLFKFKSGSKARK